MGEGENHSCKLSSDLLMLTRACARVHMRARAHTHACDFFISVTSPLRCAEGGGRWQEFWRWRVNHVNSLRSGCSTAHWHVCSLIESFIYSGSFIEQLRINYWICIISDHLHLNKYPLINKLPLTHELDFREVNIVF